MLARPVFGQTFASSSVEGRITRAETGEPVAGVRVSATSPTLERAATAISGRDGAYVLPDLPPARYRLRFTLGARRWEQAGVEVAAGRSVRVDVSIATGALARRRGGGVRGESTEQLTVVTRRMLRQLPLRGRSFVSALDLAPGAVADPEGVGFSGSTSQENRYLIDGIDVTALRDGTVGTPLLRELVDEVRILTGGYGAEHGRATGAVVEVLTRGVTDDLRGSAFVTVVPYQSDRAPVPRAATSIERTVDRDVLLDFGADLSGPLVRDRLWFYLGFAPELGRSTVTRIVQRQTDCRRVLADGSLSDCDPAEHMDGRPDEDPRTGARLLEEVDRRRFKTDSQTYHFVSKLLYAPRAGHQGQLTLLGAPTVGQGILGLDGADSATRVGVRRLPLDLGLRWRSLLQDRRTEVEASFGWHRDRVEQTPLDATALDRPTTRVFSSTLHRFGRAGGESAAALLGCEDSAGGADPYPRIENCPFREYALDAPGFVLDARERRLAGRLALTHRAELAGRHTFKVGVDAQDQVRVDVHRFTGGRYVQLVPSTEELRIYRYVDPSGGGEVCGRDGDAARACSYLDQTTVNGRTLDWAAFVQDSWQPRPGLTVDAGIRYEEQRLRYAEEIRGDVDPATGRVYGDDALTLRGLFAPRAGVAYDPTEEGRATIYARYGRYYESIPLGLNQLAFSGTSMYGAFFGFEQCEGSAPSQDATGRTPSPEDCPESSAEVPQAGERYVTGTTAVAPGAEAQHLDELVLGGEYEPFEDVRVGVAVRHRSLGQVLEDVSVDGGETYVLGNPGRFDAGEEARLQRDLERLPAGSAERDAAEARLDGLRRLRAFDEPRRDYTAIEVVAGRRVSRQLYVQGAYTYSRARGNYPGIDPRGEGEPHVSREYDLVELLANGAGLLPQDRPHQLELHGTYTFDLRELGLITTGVRVRALSGTPRDALAAHRIYGDAAAHLLPRGAQGRTEAMTRTDVHLGYGRRLAGGVRLSGFLEVINVFDQEQTYRVDERYTFDDVRPIVGGGAADLVFAKRLDGSGGETRAPVRRNVGYGQPVARYAPLLLRVGARLAF